jgi:hypothetical protein
VLIPPLERLNVEEKTSSNLRLKLHDLTSFLKSAAGHSVPVARFEQVL